jgi:hypothetical protein
MTTKTVGPMKTGGCDSTGAPEQDALNTADHRGTDKRRISKMVVYDRITAAAIPAGDGILFRPQRSRGCVRIWDLVRAERLWRKMFGYVRRVMRMIARSFFSFASLSVYRARLYCSQQPVSFGDLTEQRLCILTVPILQ